jgi:hypothetical protein
MNKRTRTVLKWSGRALIALVLILAVPISALAFPYPFFEHSDSFGHCVVYTDEEFTPGFEEVMEDVNRRLESVEVLPENCSNRVFLCHSQELYSLFAKLSRVNPNVQGFNLSIFGNTFVSVPRVNYVRSVFGGGPPYNMREGSIAHVIAHEVTHDLSQNAMGFIKYYRLPLWKREGYAEYGAIIGALRENGGPELRERISELLDDRYWGGDQDPVRTYYESWLLVEYLIEVERRSFEEIMAEDTTFDETYGAMMDWYEEGETR